MVIGLSYTLIKLKGYDNVFMYFGKDIKRLWTLLETKYGCKREQFDEIMNSKSWYDNNGYPIFIGLTIAFSHRDKMIYILYMPKFYRRKNRHMAAFSHEMLHIAIYTLTDEGIDIDLNEETLNKRMGSLITDGLDTIDLEKEKLRFERKAEMDSR